MTHTMRVQSILTVKKQQWKVLELCHEIVDSISGSYPTLPPRVEGAESEGKLHLQCGWEQQFKREIKF